MRLGFIILPGVLLTLSACGRGGATLETDNVQAEWFPKGSRTAIILENETEPGADKAARNAPAALTLLYTSHGDGQGVLSVNGNSPETATVRRQEANISATFHFKTPSREISLHEVRRSSADGNARCGTSHRSGWLPCHHGQLTPVARHAPDETERMENLDNGSADCWHGAGVPPLFRPFPGLSASPAQGQDRLSAKTRRVGPPQAHLPPGRSQPQRMAH